MPDPDPAAIEVMARGIREAPASQAPTPTALATAALAALREAGWSVTAPPGRGSQPLV